MRLFFRFKALLVWLFLFIGARAWAVTYELYTENIITPGEYLLVGYQNSSGFYYAMNHTCTSDQYMGITRVSPNSNNEILNPSASLVWTIIASTHGFYIKEGDNYLDDNATSSKNYVHVTTAPTTTAEWSFVYNSSTQTWTIKNYGSSTNRKTLSFNVGDSRVACYSNIQTGNACVYLYKRMDYGAHTVTFSINGYVDPANSLTLEEDQVISFPPNPDGLNGKIFVGWKKGAAIDGTTNIRPSMINTAKEKMGRTDVIYYAVFAIRSESPELWRRVTTVNSEGVYALLTTDGHVFSGAVSSGHGQVTASAFSFNTDDVATSVPDGICEITFRAVTGGYAMYNEDLGYLYAKSASSGSLAWKKSENSYWKYTSSNWVYNSNTAYLRSYNNGSFRTYSSASYGSVLKFAKKEGGISYSDYCTEICGTLNFIATDGAAKFATFSNTDNVIIPAEDETAFYTVYAVRVDNNGKLDFYDFVENLANKDDDGNAIVPANTGVLVKAVAKNGKTVSSLTYSYCFTDGGNYDAVFNNLVACPTAGMFFAEADTKYYKLSYGDNANKQNLGFYWGADNGGAFKVKAGVAVLAVPQNISLVKGFCFEVVEDETIIPNIDNNSYAPSAIYNISGQRMNKKQRGVNIIEGKKIVY